MIFVVDLLSTVLYKNLNLLIEYVFSWKKRIGFYEDNYRKQNPTLPKYNLNNFIKLMFKFCPVLQPHQDKVEDIIDNFNQYRTKVPVFGAILLNITLDKCVLVKGFGNGSWGFPKGKINQGESEVECAIREVIEETGFDLNGMVNDKDCIEAILRNQKVKLFIVPFIDENTVFEPHTNYEISEIRWFFVDDISPDKKTTHKLFLSHPFYQKLKSWIIRKKKSN